jgi:cell division protein FtsA
VHGLNDIVRNPIYATGVGLLHYGLKHQKGGHGRGGARASRPRSAPSGPGLFSRARQWIQNNF